MSTAKRPSDLGSWCFTWRAARSGPGTAARVHDLREIVNAILYVNRTGIPWEYLPHDFPPFKTVYDYYATWEADGTTEQVHDLLRDRTRRANARTVEPSAAVVDAQSVKTSGNVAEASQGIDAGKKIKGRKRHLITDTLDLVLIVLVTAASVHDSAGRKQALTELAAAHPSVTKVWAAAATRPASARRPPRHLRGGWYSDRKRRASIRCPNSR
ncbi:IS5 family transposase [Streptomyces lavendulocolor]|uniref:IS5 family transposase n=1 Tax=Streptomyces lavendulocolor TaxID=67316 RepID=UPI003C2BADAF